LFKIDTPSVPILNKNSIGSVLVQI